MKKSGIVAALLGLLCMFDSSGAFAQTVKVYYTSSGTFGPVPITMIIPDLPKERQRDITYPIGMWIIDHPKGLVLFDTGNNVAIADGHCKPYWPAAICDNLNPKQKREDVIDMQLKKLGYSVEQVKIVVTSHTHADHCGNMKMFPNAIHVLQRKELFDSWWPEKFQGRDRRGFFVRADLEGTREFNFLQLDGDYDLFGDGSVLILSTPGHTIGHQSMKVKTASSGTIILTGDAIFMQEILDGYGHIAGGSSVYDWVNSVNRLKFMRDIEGAQLFFPHDQDQYAAKGRRWHE